MEMEKQVNRQGREAVAFPLDVFLDACPGSGVRLKMVITGSTPFHPVILSTCHHLPKRWDSHDHSHFTNEEADSRRRRGSAQGHRHAQSSRSGSKALWTSTGPGQPVRRQPAHCLLSILTCPGSQPRVTPTQVRETWGGRGQLP